MVAEGTRIRWTQEACIQKGLSTRYLAGCVAVPGYGFLWKSRDFGVMLHFCAFLVVYVIRTDLCLCAPVYVGMWVCVFVCVYVYVCVCIYVYVLCVFVYARVCKCVLTLAALGRSVCRCERSERGAFPVLTGAQYISSLRSSQLWKQHSSTMPRLCVRRELGP